MGDENIPPQSSSAGGCSMGCAWVFVLAGLLWPFLHLIGGSVEPESGFIPVMIGGPAFLVGHILAFRALRSKSSETVAAGRSALRFMWGGIAVLILLALVAWIIDLVRGKI
jgi:hypothetical protein